MSLVCINIWHLATNSFSFDRSGAYFACSFSRFSLSVLIFLFADSIVDFFASMWSFSVFIARSCFSRDGRGTRTDCFSTFATIVFVFVRGLLLPSSLPSSSELSVVKVVVVSFEAFPSSKSVLSVVISPLMIDRVLLKSSFCSGESGRKKPSRVVVRLNRLKVFFGSFWETT